MTSIESTTTAAASVTSDAVATSAVKSIITHLKQDAARESQLGLKVKSLLDAVQGDFAKAGEQIGKAWKACSTEIEASKPIRSLIVACHDAGLVKKSANDLCKATDLVSRQRIHQLLGAVYDGEKQKKDKEPITPFAAIMKALSQAESFTEAEADLITAALLEKLA